MVIYRKQPGYIKFLKYTFIFLITLIPFLTAYKTADAETIIQDDAEIISSGEEKKLQDLCDKILKDYDTSVYIWTDNDISGGSNYGYAMEMFVATHPQKNVIILMVGMHPGDRIYEIQGYGIAQEMINNKRCGKILDKMHDDMVDGNYYSAMQVFCKESRTYMGRHPRLDSIIFSPVFQFVICLIAGIIPVAVIAYNSGGRTTTNSHTYLDVNNSKVIGSFDKYTHTTVKRTPKPHDNSTSGGGSSGGGGGSHSSGGGRSF
ncbi:MAG: TPM domain-containing protein [Lachnospiraceae bacterium]|nr:TPM domain-containing protein [Lachnospiraceae bacterium]